MGSNVEKILTEKYEQGFEALGKLASAREKEQRFTAMGFASNLDIIFDFRVEKLNELLARYLPEARLEDMRPAKAICSMEDLLRSIVYFCTHGAGGEVDVENTALFEECFPYREAIGGTAAQAAMAIARIGCPSVSCLVDDSKELCRLLESPYIFTVSKDGKLIHTDQVLPQHHRERHGVVQFKKQDVICLGEQRVEIPASNRVMLTEKTDNINLPLSQAFFDWLLENAEKTASIMLSGFNVVLDQKILNDRILRLQEFIKQYRLANAHGIVWLEDAHYHDPDIRKCCLETLNPSVDIMSLNEEELVYTLQKTYRHAVDEKDIFSCIEGLEFLRKKYGLRKGMILHTKDYSMYVGEPLEADIEQGLIFGNLLATAKAKNGSYGTREQIKEVLSFGFSGQGLDHYKKVKNSSYADEVVLVPSKYIEKPQYTVGLGDSFAGGVQICF